MENPFIQHIPFLFVCNKMDQAIITMADVQNNLELQKYRKRNIKLISACSLTGEGLKEGF
jgi:hypothetical protein